MIAAFLALLYVALKPLSDGLLDTSAWVAKILSPPGVGSSDEFVKVNQAALMDGWLSNIPFITPIFFIASLISAVFFHWWAALALFFVTIVMSVLAKMLWTKQVSHYVLFLYHKMVNRMADYRRQNDITRLEATETYVKDLEQIISLYRNARLRPPTPKQLEAIPSGDLRYWLDHGA